MGNSVPMRLHNSATGRVDITNGEVRLWVALSYVWKQYEDDAKLKEAIKHLAGKVGTDHF